MVNSSLHRRSTGDLDAPADAEAEDTSEVLDAEDISAELLGDADEPPTITMSRPAARMQPSAAGLAARLEEAEAELNRLRRHMRARDAYLAELEHALHASTSKLEASGISSVEDAHRLFGRLRGQAFRIAELEAELRQMEQRVSRLARLVPRSVSD